MVVVIAYADRPVVRLERRDESVIGLASAVHPIALVDVDDSIFPVEPTERCRR